MKEFQNLNQEEQMDLRIVEHLDMQNLPESIQSMLLTGTFSQYKALVPSVENGYFSRLLTLVERGSHPFEKSQATGKSDPVTGKRCIARFINFVCAILLREKQSG